MATEKCTIPGFETVSVTFPDPDAWRMAHRDQFYRGMGAAPSGAAPGTRLLYGCIALCEKIEGIKTDDISGLKLRYVPVFDWLVEVVNGAYIAASQPPKK